MVFSSAIFLFAFLPAVFIIYRLLPGILSRNVFLAFSSLVFYAFGQLVYLPLFLASIAAEWFFMRKGRGREREKPCGKLRRAFVHIDEKFR